MIQASVVIPAYKAENTISVAVKSALAQGDCVGEVIVVVDGVFDKTAEVLNVIDDPRLKIIIFDENKGAQIARNKGLAMANCDAIVFLDSDDYFEENLIINALSVMNNGSYDFVLSPNSIALMNGLKKYYEVPYDTHPFDLLIGRIISTLAVGIQCITWKRAFVTALDGWDENVERNQDGALMIKALLNGGRPGYNTKGAGCSVQHEGVRVSASRSLSSFMTQGVIFRNIYSYLTKSELPWYKRDKLLASLNYFCINICVGMAESGFKGSDYQIWKNRINWKFQHFFQLPKNKSLQAMIFFGFGHDAFKVKSYLRRISESFRLNAR